ncbi:hypothetical protein K7I13_11835 [Brucepastera parasyntrophica]|uniref:hypothetical protein n=1 Tax=Brucepastera parasyntrophica TaxID=2880008 RepID=UPI00210921CC|nr:hypothetical protein [Brucepastera parasyntrophica]ULQ59179.1 hypothetical protein K7I13_11835 [Brucepastera parasyntrophica]
MKRNLFVVLGFILMLSGCEMLGKTEYSVSYSVFCSGGEVESIRYRDKDKIEKIVYNPRETVDYYWRESFYVEAPFVPEIHVKFRSDSIYGFCLVYLSAREYGEEDYLYDLEERIDNLPDGKVGNVHIYGDPLN